MAPEKLAIMQEQKAHCNQMTHGRLSIHSCATNPEVSSLGSNADRTEKARLPLFISVKRLGWGWSWCQTWIPFQKVLKSERNSKEQSKNKTLVTNKDKRKSISNQLNTKDL